MAKKLYKDAFTSKRRLAWIRSRSQADYRREPWTLTFEDFCHIWRDESLWQQRGRASDDLVLFRYDAEQPWSLNNCCIVTRYNFLQINAARRVGRDDSLYFKDAIWP